MLSLLDTPLHRIQHRALPGACLLGFLVALGSGAVSAAPVAGPAPAPRVAAAGEGPSLVIPRPVHDFGTVFEGALLEHTFSMTASGDEDLVIQKIKPSCGCTVAEVWRVDAEGQRTPYEEGTALAPGSRIELVTRFETKGRRGRQTKPVSVYSNSPRGVLEVKLEARVETLLSAAPATIDLGRFSVRESGSGSAVVSTNDGEPVGLTVDAGALPSPLAVELTPLEPDAEGRAARWQVDAHLPVGASDGFFRHMVALVTDRPQLDAPPLEDGTPATHVFELRVDAQVSALVTAKPSYMSFGLVRSDMLMSRSVRVNLYDPTMELPTPTWEILDGKGAEPFAFASACTVTVRPIEEVRGWDVELSIDQLPPTFEAAFHGRVVLHFGESVPPLEISFTGFHRPTVRPQGARGRSGPPRPPGATKQGPDRGPAERGSNGTAEGDAP